ncbi:NifU-related protein [Niveomyces insectorum RCEF 264]|uniref:NifU-related protein n=1 Tax=Niveomyces insectorum RCEF 264 TaxID=1081102 RepID=A0A167ZA74_9HYPO|nr:NifU-related protein [Niveomyces insectorum RCEF 264]
MSKASLSRAVTSATPRPAFCRHMPRVAYAALPVTASLSSPSSLSASLSSSSSPSPSPSPRFYHAASRVRPRAARSRLYGNGNGNSNPMASPGGSRRTIFIQTETTPNADALKFLPNHPVLPPDLHGTVPFLEYLSPRATIAPPYPSPLAAQLLAVDGVTSVFYGRDFVTVTKAPDANWAHIRPEVFALITEAVTSGQPVVRVVVDGTADADAGSNTKAHHARASDADGNTAASAADTLQYDENDSEVVGMIKELLETRIRPAIQEDGGDIEFRGFENGQVLLKLRGACRTCDSSTVTLKNGIEGMLMHYIEEVQGVTQVLDQEEEIALQEFAKFEEKLRQQKGAAPPGTTGKGTLDTAEA